ncbi:MAG: hypothetical protein R2942_18205 [Ignavibacteria bacterium]
MVAKKKTVMTIEEKLKEFEERSRKNLELQETLKDKQTRNHLRITFRNPEKIRSSFGRRCKNKNI